MEIKHIKSNITGGHFGFSSDRCDKVFVNKMKEAQLIKLLPTDVVVDIGGYVGEFSMWAQSQNVKKVITFEATPNTFKVLKMNKKPRMQIHNLAVVGDDSKEIKLYLSKGIGVTNSIVKSKDNFIVVPAIKYEDAISEASVVKIDVEGAEYTFDILGNLKNIRAITIEWHPIVGKNWKREARRIMRKIEEFGFECLYSPSFENGWDMNCTFVRG